MKDYCRGCYHCYNGECIRGKGDYCPANSIKAERRKQKKQEVNPKKIRAVYGSVKEWFSSFAVGEIRAVGPEMSWSTIRSTATRMRKDYGTSFGVYKLNKRLSVVRLS